MFPADFGKNFRDLGVPSAIETATPTEIQGFMKIGLQVAEVGVPEDTQDSDVIRALEKAAPAVSRYTTTKNAFESVVSGSLVSDYDFGPPRHRDPFNPVEN